LLGELDTQCAKEGFPIPDHSTLLQDPIFNQRPEQLSVQQFIELTNRVSDEYKR
jgi:16S rRNA (adenine1518-N6/adenine1519-N6)-dimethyltransferase